MNRYIEVNDMRKVIVDHAWRGPILAIYKEPSDFVGKKFIGRLWNGKKPTCFIVVGDTLEEIRNKIPKNMHLIPRYYNDDPVIVECWI